MYPACHLSIGLFIIAYQLTRYYFRFRIIRTKLGPKFKERAPKVADSQIKQLLREHLQKKREVDEEDEMKPEIVHQQRECRTESMMQTSYS